MKGRALIRSLRLLGVSVGLVAAGVAFVALVAILAVLAAFTGGPALVQMGDLLSGR